MESAAAQLSNSSQPNHHWLSPFNLSGVSSYCFFKVNITSTSQNNITSTSQNNIKSTSQNNITQCWLVIIPKSMTKDVHNITTPTYSIELKLLFECILIDFVQLFQYCLKIELTIYDSSLILCHSLDVLQYFNVSFNSLEIDKKLVRAVSNVIRDISQKIPVVFCDFFHYQKGDTFNTCLREISTLLRNHFNTKNSNISFVNTNDNSLIRKAFVTTRSPFSIVESILILYGLPDFK